MRLRCAAALAAIGAAMAGCQYIPGTAQASEAQAREALAPVLADAASAQLRNVKMKGELICGEVNAKNVLGAYVGYRRFLRVAASADPALEPDCGEDYDGSGMSCAAATDLFRSTWASSCA